VTDVLRDLRPPPSPGFEVRFETPRDDFARFQVIFTDELSETGLFGCSHSCSASVA
jgi:hypothetical protein